MDIGRERFAQESDEIEPITVGSECGVERILDLKVEDLEPQLLSVTSCVVLGGSFNLSKPQFLHL